MGRVIEILGYPDDFGIDVEIVIRKHHLPHHFPEEVIRQAQAIPHGIDPAELDRRRDFRDLQIVTIDGETARDFDDAVWVEQLSNGNFALAGAYCGREPLRSARFSHRSRSAQPRNQRLFPRSRCSHAAGRALDRYMFPAPARRPVGALGVAGNRPPGRYRCPGIHPWSDSQRRAHDLHATCSACSKATRRCANATARSPTASSLCASSR